MAQFLVLLDQSDFFGDSTGGAAKPKLSGNADEIKRLVPEADPSALNARQISVVIPDTVDVSAMQELIRNNFEDVVGFVNAVNPLPENDSATDEYMQAPAVSLPQNEIDSGIIELGDVYEVDDEGRPK
ncbi:hypothetical protein HYZ99_01260 [Candidatus Peregrinibacteria bacterium]|nr:hypothetical protein [Candidatus Peregrinibacteria bacterium]